jgi:hypothetical protein
MAHLGGNRKGAGRPLLSNEKMTTKSIRLPSLIVDQLGEIEDSKGLSHLTREALIEKYNLRQPD